MKIGALLENDYQLGHPESAIAGGSSSTITTNV